MLFHILRKVPAFQDSVPHAGAEPVLICGVENEPAIPHARPDAESKKIVRAALRRELSRAPPESSSFGQLFA